jgi:hypothetical protein
MYRLLLLMLLLLGFLPISAQSPHGDDLKIDCAQCHNPSGWSIDYKTIKFEHSNTEFELEGLHAQTDCKQCHKTLIFKGAPSECVACHTDMHSMSVGNDCARCHTPQSWLVDNIPELHEENGFPLVGAHSNLSCEDCHLSETGLRFDRIGNECISCHRQDFQSTQNPNHISSGFSTNCIECHNPLDFGWESDINHDFFALTLGHDIQDCKQCHKTTSYSDASSECISCHQTDYNQTTEPNHLSSNFPTDCASCHTTNPGWSPATFDHEFFPLTLGHDIQDCKQCHKTGNYSDVSSECVSCHQIDYNQTTDPNHQTANFTTDCASCHTTNPGWSPAEFPHDFFPLTLGHDQLSCKECHTTGNYSDASPECVTCHQGDYNQTTDPNHQTLSFPTDCASCHTTNPGWSPATFDHDFFPLTLGHNGVSCSQCHTTGNYSDVSPECVSCHQSDYNQTSDPKHQAPNFSTDCASCHTTNPGWSPADFDHDFFPRTLGHDIQGCTQCHTTGNYSDASPECVSCHQGDYNNTTNPNHSSAQFPTDCVSCHTTNPGWSPATFDHDGMYFPIYSGKHEGEWNSCTDCHTNTNNYADFTCLTCHTQSKTNSKHDGVNNYVYASNACLQCHPDGRD